MGWEAVRDNDANGEQLPKIYRAAAVVKFEASLVHTHWHAEVDLEFLLIVGSVSSLYLILGYKSPAPPKSQERALEWQRFCIYIYTTMCDGERKMKVKKRNQFYTPAIHTLFSPSSSTPLRPQLF